MGNVEGFHWRRSVKWQILGFEFNRFWMTIQVIVEVWDVCWKLWKLDKENIAKLHWRFHQYEKDCISVNKILVYCSKMRESFANQGCLQIKALMIPVDAQ